MPIRQATKEHQKVQTTVQKVEMADAHCHLDLISEEEIAKAIEHGVLTIVTNGVNTRTNRAALKLSDKKHIFPALGIDPENALKIDNLNVDEEIDLNIQLIKANRDRVVAIGEIGLDYMKASSFELVAIQRTVFERFLHTAKELDLPVTVHSRESMNDVLTILKDMNMQKVQLHFFEGSIAQAKAAEREGYMISIPPIESAKRRQIIRDVAIDNLLVESDSPAVGATPLDVQRSLRFIADSKGISFERAAEAIVHNTKKFFNIHTRGTIMRA